MLISHKQLFYASVGQLCLKTAYMQVRQLTHAVILLAVFFATFVLIFSTRETAEQPLHSSKMNMNYHTQHILFIKHTVFTAGLYVHSCLQKIRLVQGITSFSPALPFSILRLGLHLQLFWYDVLTNCIASSCEDVIEKDQTFVQNHRSTVSIRCRKFRLLIRQYCISIGDVGRFLT